MEQWFILIFKCFDTSMSPRITHTEKQDNIPNIVKRFGKSDFHLVSITRIESENAPIHTIGPVQPL